MDIATRFQPRNRPQAYLDHERDAMPDDSGEEPSETHAHRKIQRTTTDADASHTFRKPSLPASATRQPPSGLENRPGLSQSQRRRSTLRENVRVPSGPRELPSPGRRLGGINHNTGHITTPTLMHDTTNNHDRSFLPQSHSESFLVDDNSNNGSSSFIDRLAPSAKAPPRFRFGAEHGNRVSSTSETGSPTTPAGRLTDGFAFVPTMNFDDFQNSIVDPSHWSSPQLSEFPETSAGRALPKEQSGQKESGNRMAKSGGFASSTTTRPNGLSSKHQQGEQGGMAGEDIGTTPSWTSLRQRRTSNAPAASRQASGQPGGVTQPMPSSVSQPNLSVRTKRQSTLPSTHSAHPLPTAASRPPRKSVGPGLLTSMMSSESRKDSFATPTTIGGASLKPALTRTSSLSNATRRPTLHSSALNGAEMPRLSTSTATTQSRANKVKSLQPPPRQQPPDPDTPNARSGSKGNPNRAHTPSSMGNKRQSTASGRASGLGARTISPTDARRLKRLSTTQAPPMPTAPLNKGPPTPQDEPVSQPWAANLNAVKTELPRFTQPSPSLIPRKMSASTPSSIRASPEGRYLPLGGGVGGGNGGGVSVLSSKSSYQSLLSNSATSGSRLPTPKPRQTHSSAAQYGDGNQELVPPVPAIPKAYDSPKEHEQPFFSGFSSKSSHSPFSTGPEQTSGLDIGTETILPPTDAQHMEFQLRPIETPREKPGEVRRPEHKRTNTVGNTATTAAGSKPFSRPQPDPAGRKNNNLQPLRLPPLNLMPISVSPYDKPTLAYQASTALPRPSNEIDNREEYTLGMKTPDPGFKRNAKTPSTPMTASKATFWRRHEDKDTKMRSSSSHYALRDLTGMGMGEESSTVERSFFDDSDTENTGGGGTANVFGIPIPAVGGASKTRQQAITPFASGSLPKGSGEWSRHQLRGRPSGEYHDDYDLGAYAENMHLASAKPQGPRPRVPLQPALLGKTGTPSSTESGKAESQVHSLEVEKRREGKQKEEKENSASGGGGGGLRRKLSLGWRRTSSKAVNHAENASKQSPSLPQHQQDSALMPGEKEMGGQWQKRPSGSESMPPPKLPASAAAGQQYSEKSGDGGVPSLPRPSLDERASRRKSTLPNVPVYGGSGAPPGGDLEPPSTAPPGPKTRSLHSEDPQPVPQSASARSSSWASSAVNGTNTNTQPSSRQGPIGRLSTVSSRGHKLTASTLSAIIKDKDDLAADEEMRKLSQKRRDVDTAARESEALKARALARSPVAPEQVLHDVNCSLNIFERGEIVDYQKEGVFFTGAKGCRKIIGSLANLLPVDLSGKEGKDGGKDKMGNFGYDDERGDYNIVLGDHLAYRYEVVDVLGKGSFGQVVRCVDHKEGGVVAVKIIRNKKRFHQQALVEVGILGRLGEWDPDGAHATLSITRSFYFRSHLCIVTPCLSINLYEFIRAHNFAGFSLPLIRRFSRQLLVCLTLLQTKRIIHCDLKPENILLCEARKADVRVIDFGSSCREEEKVYTYIQSRFYRSPEVILGSSYGLGIDMWSLGCILAELWTGYPIFPGENEQEQLACIMEIFGPPDRHLVERCTRKKLFFDSVGKPRVTVSSKGRRRRPSSKTLAQALKTDDEAFLDFITRCLRWDPDRRLKPAEAVGHPFITGLPLNQRPGIPEEARRAARVRSTQAASPVKRAAVAKEGNAFAQQQQQQAAATTPAGKDRSRGAQPDTPQTAVRNNATASGPGGQGSPSKVQAASRRQSTMFTAGGATAVAGSKKVSSGATLGSGFAAGVAGQQQRMTSGNLSSSSSSAGGPTASLAQMAARESMSATAQQGGGAQARWRA